MRVSPGHAPNWASPPVGRKTRSANSLAEDTPNGICRTVRAQAYPFVGAQRSWWGSTNVKDVSAIRLSLLLQVHDRPAQIAEATSYLYAGSAGNAQTPSNRRSTGRSAA